jgi:hypothetical protein
MGWRLSLLLRPRHQTRFERPELDVLAVTKLLGRMAIPVPKKCIEAFIILS